MPEKHSHTEQMAQNINDGIDRDSDAYKLGACEADNKCLRASMRLVSQRLYGLSTVTHSNGAVKECAEYLDGKLGEDNSAALQTFGT